MATIALQPKQEAAEDRRRRRLAIKRRLKRDFPYYAEKCLKIRPKEGALIPLRLNHVQRLIHQRLEEQLAQTGRVRALILKARQPGCSTYVEARYYWKVSFRKGVRAFILTHKQEATNNLFDMSQRFHQHCPEFIKPHTGRSNAKEFLFDRLDSGYRVGTAGTEGVGRSETIQFFHGSEVAIWTNAEDHVDGVLQAVPEADGTEIILESTAKGLGGLFHSMCKAAERGDSEYQLIFIAWFWHDEYRREPPEDWAAPEAFREYGELHGLEPDQVYWAYRKNRNLAQSVSGDPNEISWKFRQEYPATAEEAFQTGDSESFIKTELVLKARKNTVEPDSRTPIVFGLDIARGGKDKTRLIDRQGRKLGGILNMKIDTDNLMAIVGMVAEQIDLIHPKRVFIDITGIGAGVYDRLCENGYSGIVEAVNFGERANDDDKYANKRAEMWGEMRDWFADSAGVDVPDDDELHTDMCAPIIGPGATEYDSNSRLVLESKKHMRKRGVSSPDIGDAAALTFAERVHVEQPPADTEKPDRYQKAMDRLRNRHGSWMTQ